MKRLLGITIVVAFAMTPALAQKVTIVGPLVVRESRMNKIGRRDARIDRNPVNDSLNQFGPPAWDVVSPPVSVRTVVPE